MSDAVSLGLGFAGSKPHATSRIGLLYMGAAVAAGTGAAVAAMAHPTAPLEGPLMLLLRFMAIIKAAMALGAVVLTHWRLRLPIGGALTAGYSASLVAMMVAPGLIWSLTHIALGAGLFHLGLLTFLVLAWRDDPIGGMLTRRPGP